MLIFLWSLIDKRTLNFGLNPKMISGNGVVEYGFQNFKTTIPIFRRCICWKLSNKMKTVLYLSGWNGEWSWITVTGKTCMCLYFTVARYSANFLLPQNRITTLSHI